MCGFAGQYRLDGLAADFEAVEAAAGRLAHRGPDDTASWREGPVALAFRRLSILDIEGGRQPMRTEDGRLCIVFNGEIYNHPQLKRELEGRGVRYRTRSDTETILRLFEREGEKTFRRLEGMFALALFDARKPKLLLARDPLGVKPLYYHFDGQRLSFASELRALAALMPALRLDPEAVVDYLAYGMVHAPRTALKEARKLPPGHLLRLDATGIHVERFWEMPAWRRGPKASRRAPPSPASGEQQAPARTARPGAPQAPEPSIEEAEAEVERLLGESVKGQLLSDVPVGAFLSGGVDSSLVTALMAREVQGPVQTFSIGFSGARSGLDESAYARAVAKHLKTDHHELILSADVLDGAADLAGCLDEPIADSAILPTYLLARFARERVKVVLSGEGADELFAGYNRYKAAYLSEKIGLLPRWTRPFAAVAARRMGKGRVFAGIPYERLEDWGRAFAHCEPPAFEGLLRGDFLESVQEDPFDWLKGFDGEHSLGGAQAFDLQTVLCDALLMKVDKATMRAGLEARVPYLDRRLVEYALSLPPECKIRLLKGKFLLRRLAAKRLPKEIAFRRKHGFIVPWEEWVRSPKTSLLDEMLADPGFEGLGIFDLSALRGHFAQLREGSREVDSGIAYRIAVLWMWYDGLRRL
ncbi:MAG: asparagine synthase (glutamine-hydrolyzing) [Elusimicrobia bacterium]|nr:asparagine synthase (glutamine-hydrolyzing) [Elusimicrobiota bacterium]